MREQIKSAAVRALPWNRKAAKILQELFAPKIPPDLPPRLKWERRVEGPMFLASLAFLAFYAWNALGDNDRVFTHLASVGMWIIWGSFVVDYLVRFILTQDRARWFWHHWWELLLIIMPMFRPLRALRVLPTLVLLQRFSASNARVTVALYTSVATVLIIIVAAISLYDVEGRMPGSAVDNFGDAIWWALTTVTTVGYGDIAPISSEGRLVGAMLMLSGIAVAGVVTAMVSAWLVEQVQEDFSAAEHVTESNRHNEIMRTLRALNSEVDTLRQEVAQLRAVNAEPNLGTNPEPGSGGSAVVPTVETAPPAEDHDKKHRKEKRRKSGHKKVPGWLSWPFHHSHEKEPESEESAGELPDQQADKQADERQSPEETERTEDLEGNQRHEEPGESPEEGEIPGEVVDPEQGKSPEDSEEPGEAEDRR